MSQVTAYSDLYPLVRQFVGSARDPLLLQALQWAGRQLTVQTEGLEDELTPIPVVDWQRGYDLDGYIPYSSMAIHRLKRVLVNGREYDSDDYELFREDILRFRSPSVPHDIDSRMLTCGTAGEAVYSVWAAITDGSVGITLSNSATAVTAIDFTGVADMDEVALAIQTAWRDAAETNDGYIRWYTDKFVLWTESGDISYLTADATGTDISGSGYMNGLTGTGSLAPHMHVEAIFRMNIRSETLPSWYLDRYAEMLMAGAIVYICKQPQHKDAALQAEWEPMWQDGLNKGKAEIGFQKKDDGYRIGA